MEQNNILCECRVWLLALLYE